MATITMDMPAIGADLQPIPDKRVTIVMDTPDAAVIAVVQATCKQTGYKGSEPGLHTMEETKKHWANVAREYNTQQGTAAVRATVDAQLAPLVGAVTYEKDGKPVSKDSI